MNIRPVGAEFFNTEDRRKSSQTKIIFTFRNSANSPKNIARNAAYILRVSWNWELDEQG